MISCMIGTELALFLALLNVNPIPLDEGTALFFNGQYEGEIHIYAITEEIDEESQQLLWCYQEQ